MGFLAHSVYRSLTSAGSDEAIFVSKCASLNGQELTYVNISTLNGLMYIEEGSTVGLRPLSAEYIEMYKQSFIKEVNPVLPHPKIYNESFDISRGGLDNDWRCNIQLDKTAQRMQTRSYFAPD